MHWLIVGAGALGSLIGGKLVLGGDEVTLVVRSYAIEQLEADGLTIVIDDTSETITPNAVTSLAEAFEKFGSFDVVALTMKTFAVADAADELAELDRELPPVVTFQNGVGNEETVADRLPETSLVAASITTPVESMDDGVIRSVDKGGIGLAVVQGEPAVGDIAASLRSAGFETALYDDYRSMVWSKLLLNIIGNATSAILGWWPERVFANKELFNIELAAWQEARSVMDALDLKVVSLPGYALGLYAPFIGVLPARILQPLMRRAVAGGRGGKMPSMYLDLEAGREQLEVGDLNGAIVRYGQETGVPTPVNAALTRILSRLADGTLEWDKYRDNPLRLIQDVRTSITATVAVG